jgi:tRNA(Ile)-lysidine synthase
MLPEFENKLTSFIKAHALFDSAPKVVLAVSGGADSTALLYAMQALKAENILQAEFVCAHIHHQLRGAEADCDEEFVIEQAAELNLMVATKRVDVRGFARDHKLSIETAARQCRIKALMEIATAAHCDRIATAHQKNDNAETVLHRLVRGTGFRGLGGIWPKRIFAEGLTFIRPMLCVTREEVVEYLQTRNVTWRRDRTNADCTYKRNSIRHRLLPALQQDCSDSIVDMLSQLAQSARRFYDLVCERADEVWPSLAECAAEKTILDLKGFQAQSPPVKIELIRRSLIRLDCGQRDLTQRHYERIVQLAGHSVTAGRIDLPGGFAVRREYENVIFSRDRGVNGRVSLSQRVNLNIPGRTKFGKFLVEATIGAAERNGFQKCVTSKESNVECFDLEKVKLPLSIRCRIPGDRFVPLGLSGEKKIGKFLTAQRIPYEVRKKVVLVEDREKIIWLWPVRISEQAKVTTDTKQILRMNIAESDAE